MEMEVDTDMKYVNVKTHQFHVLYVIQVQVRDVWELYLWSSRRHMSPRETHWYTEEMSLLHSTSFLGDLSKYLKTILWSPFLVSILIILFPHIDLTDKNFQEQRFKLLSKEKTLWEWWHHKSQTSRVCFSSYFSRFSRISLFLDFAYLTSFACPHNPTTHSGY